MFHQLAPARAAETAHAPADERGITLQTLIVTAVLVLMAVAAGVVIVALTNSSSDDLEESGTDVQARCNSVEIYDPRVAARNELGIHEGTNFRGSAIGCIPVCVLDTGHADGALTPADRMISADELGYSRGSPTTTLPQSLFANPVPGGSSILGPQAFLLADGKVENGKVTVFAVLSENQKRFARMELGLPEDDPANLTRIDVEPRIARIAIAPNQNQCLAYDSSGEPILG